MKTMGVLTLVLWLAVTLLSVVAQETGAITVDFAPYDNNPVLPLGESGAWDSGSVNAGRVVYRDGMFHMLYAGSEGSPDLSAVGYAVSEDGFTWTKYHANPVLELDELIATSESVTLVLLMDGDTWVLYIQPLSTYRVYRATALDPTGPWMVDPQPVLESGSDGTWDRLFAIDSLVRTDANFMMYYAAFGAGGIGLATSPDGVSWLRTSDPVFQPRFVGDVWDRDWVLDASVRQDDSGWEMFYTGGQAGTSEEASGFATIGYATSEDGLAWVRQSEPILPPEEGWQYSVGAVVVVEDTYYLYYDMEDISRTTMQPSRGIGLATGTITRE